MKQSNVIKKDKLSQIKLELSEKYKGFLFTDLVKLSTTFQYLCDLTKRATIFTSCALPRLYLYILSKKIDHIVLN